MCQKGCCLPKRTVARPPFAAPRPRIPSRPVARRRACPQNAAVAMVRRPAAWAGHTSHSRLGDHALPIAVGLGWRWDARHEHSLMSISVAWSRLYSPQRRQRSEELRLLRFQSKRQGRRDLLLPPVPVQMPLAGPELAAEQASTLMCRVHGLEPRIQRAIRCRFPSLALFPAWVCLERSGSSAAAAATASDPPGRQLPVRPAGARCGLAA